MPKSNLDKIKPITPNQTSKYPSIGQKTSSTPTLAGGSPIPTEKASGAGKGAAQNAGKSTGAGNSGKSSTGSKSGTGSTGTGKPLDRDPLGSAMTTSPTAPWAEKNTTPTLPGGSPVPEQKSTPSKSDSAAGAGSSTSSGTGTSSGSRSGSQAANKEQSRASDAGSDTGSGADSGSGAGSSSDSGSGAGGRLDRTGKKKSDLPDLTGQLEQWFDAAKEQSNASIDYATEQGIKELQRAEEDAQSQFQAQQRQIAIDEARGLDNQALYAEARGDRGGIGAAQYNSIMSAAAQNRMAVNQQRTKLATDTARQIADLRAQGEYKKADAVLELTQNFLGQLMSLEQWALNYQLDVDQFNFQLEKWQADYTQSSAELGGTSSTGTGGSGGSSSGRTGFDPSGLTTSEVMEWQRRLGVTADGIWGPKTQAAYEAAYGGSSGSTQFTGTRPNTSRTSLDYSQDEGIFTYAGRTYGTVAGVINAINSANLSDAEFAEVKAKLEALTGVKWQ